jgi:hypothetical protein
MLRCKEVDKTSGEHVNIVLHAAVTESAVSVVERGMIDSEPSLSDMYL